ncbi:dihydroxyacetone kinase subunit DhaL [Altericroceibacterium xinjiangense]|uniref:dihydroxyacetone kinase subunit DhaL n=1 Tax=Altericroceibacterium xinjiangense TaxID=762261 RepID=UPI000F7E4372|nr:dihydroxyacetone kinase subunit DhaL [Altericroceibacterium xinjiangense]
MSDITIGNVERAIKTTADTVLANQQYFSDLDGIAGDGDFGASLASGFRLIDADLPEIDKSSIGNMLLKISMIITKNVGGCSGPIWGTGFMRAAMLTKEKQEIGLADLEQMVGAAIEGIKARGGADLGDKTLLDSLIPIHEKLKEHAEKGSSPAVALRDAAEVAERKMEEAKALQPRRGRQSFVGERATGTPDPGMVAIACILQDWCEQFGVERTPQAKELTQRSV